MTDPLFINNFQNLGPVAWQRIVQKSFSGSIPKKKPFISKISVEMLNILSFRTKKTGSLIFERNLNFVNRGRKDIFLQNLPGLYVTSI